MDDSLGTIEEELEQLELSSTDTDSGVDDSTQHQRPKSARGIAPINTTLPSINTSRMTTSSTLRRPTSRIPTKSVAEVETPGTNCGRRTRTHAPTSSARVSRSQSTPATPKPRFNFGTTNTSATGPKKVPMNRVVVGTAPSPNLTVSQARIGSLSNASHKPGGGQVRIESRKLEWTTSARTSTIRVGGHQAGGGDKKIEQRRLNWKAESKVGSLEKATHRAGGGDVKIENRKLDWKAESKVGSTKNMKHKPQGGDVQIYDEKVDWQTDSRVGSRKNIQHRAGGGDVKIFNKKIEVVSESKVGSTKNIRHTAGGGDIKIHDEKVEFRVGSRIGSLANVKHRAGGGEKKIFDDKKYLRQSQADGALSRSISSSRASSVMGSSSTLDEKSGTLKRVKKVTPPTPSSSSSYSSQILRKISPMSTGF